MSSERLLRINNSRVRAPNPEDHEVRGGRGRRKSKRRRREGAAGVGAGGGGERRVFNAASLGATRITKVKKEVFNNFSFSLYLLSHVS